MVIFKTRLHSRKKADLSLQVVVAAALALFVLIVLFIIIGGKLKPAADFYGDCQKAGGTPTSKDEPCPDEKPMVSPFTTNDEQKCCVHASDLVPG